jgi:hypothetical protein
MLTENKQTMVREHRSWPAQVAWVVQSMKKEIYIFIVLFSKVLKFNVYCNIRQNKFL